MLLKQENVFNFVLFWQYFNLSYEHTEVRERSSGQGVSVCPSICIRIFVKYCLMSDCFVTYNKLKKKLCKIFFNDR